MLPKYKSQIWFPNALKVVSHVVAMVDGDPGTACGTTINAFGKQIWEE